MSDDIPARWLPDLERRGLASYRRLGEAAGVSHETARRVVLGYRTSVATVDKIARAIGVPVERVHELRGEDSPSPLKAWNPPASASELTHEEREALGRLVSLMTAERMKGRGGDARGSASSKRAGGSPAPSSSDEATLIDSMAEHLVRRKLAEGLDAGAARVAARLIVQEGLAASDAVVAAKGISLPPGDTVAPVTVLRPTGPEASKTRPRAARRKPAGGSRKEQLDRAQDDAAQAPDPEGPGAGA